MYVCMYVCISLLKIYVQQTGEKHWITPTTEATLQCQNALLSKIIYEHINQDLTQTKF